MWYFKSVTLRPISFSKFRGLFSFLIEISIRRWILFSISFNIQRTYIFITISKTSWSSRSTKSPWNSIIKFSFESWVFIKSKIIKLFTFKLCRRTLQVYYAWVKMKINTLRFLCLIQSTYVLIRTVIKLKE